MRKKEKHQIQDQNQNSASSPPWQDLNPYLLSMIFARLSLQDQLSGPAYVCRAWLSAALFALFPNSVLDLSLIDKLRGRRQRLRFTLLLKQALDTYDGWVAIYFPSKFVFGYFATAYIAEKTPNVASLFLSSDLVAGSMALPLCVSFMYWKKLRVFHSRVINPEEGFAVLTQLADFCGNLVELGVHGRITERQVVCIVEGFPRLRVLDLSESCLYSTTLGILLERGSKYLKQLNILHCMILDDEDGKDIRDGHYCLVRKWRREMLGKASTNLKNLKMFMHCLEMDIISCAKCRDVKSKYNKNLAK
ncbi:hypothetical protein AB3S75_019737 [Citrus x aurantiifolia]